METTLYLSAAEMQFFDALSVALKAGWTAELETLQYKDSSKQRQIRLDLMEIDDGRFENVLVKCGPHCTEERLEKLVSDLDLPALTLKDMWEIFFVLGPESISYMIGKFLVSVKTDDDLDLVAALSYLRHSFLISFQPVS